MAGGSIGLTAFPYLTEEKSMFSVQRAVAAASLTFLLGVPAGAQAQPSTARAFGVGQTDIGPTVGLGGLGGASLAIGGRFERGIKTLPDLGNGVLGIGVSADWYHYSQNFAVGPDFDFTYIPIAATANYHINLENKKFDPFLGLGLGYQIVTTSYGGSYDSGIYVVGRLGMRYFMAPKMALYADVGAGAATLNVGVVFKIKGS